MIKMTALKTFHKEFALESGPVKVPHLCREKWLVIMTPKLSGVQQLLLQTPSNPMFCSF